MKNFFSSIIIGFILLFTIYNQAQADYIEGFGNYTCDQTFPVVKLRWEKDNMYTYNFYDTVSTPITIGIDGYRVAIQEQGDFDNSGKINGVDRSASLMNFDFTNSLRNNSFIVEAGTSNFRWLESNNNYNIYNRPVKRDSKNLYLVYEMNYYKKINGSWDMSRLHSHYECQPYEITWCGDGVVDDYTDPSGERIKETCDPNDPNKAGWGNGGCDPVTCEPVVNPEPAVCTNLDTTKVSGYEGMTSSFSCTGQHVDSYKIVIKNANGQVVKTLANNSSYTFPTAGDFTATCFVSNDEVTDATAPSCKDTIKVTKQPVPECTGLTVNNADGVIDFTSRLSCTGKNTDNFKIQIKNQSGVVVSSINNNVLDYSFTTPGSYTATCYVENDKTSPACQTVITARQPAPTCDAITVNPKKGEAPLISDITCQGSNTSTYKIFIRDGSGNLVKTFDRKKVEDYKFTTPGSYKVSCEAGGVTSNDCATGVLVEEPKVPSIQVTKSDGNNDDLLPNLAPKNDVQTVLEGDDAVFTIKVTNNGTEDLKNVVLIDDVLKDDRDAPNCDKNASQTATLIQKVGNKDSIFNVGESFTYTCKRTNTEKDYTNVIKVSGVGVSSGTTVRDDDPTDVKTLTPSIDVIKSDANASDLKPNLAPKNDVQTVLIGDKAVFEITVVNNGTEALKNIVLTDDVLDDNRDAPSCDKTANQTATLIKNVGNKDAILDVGESFSYTCERENTENKYTNMITVDGVGVTSNEEVSEDDPSYVEIVENPEIEVLKTDANDEDLELGDDNNPILRNDTQIVEKGDTAVFEITVTNTGGEDLTDVVLIDDVLNEDRDAPSCNKTAAQTDSMIRKIGNNDAVFNVGESFTYTCERTNTEESYINSIEVTGVGVNSKEEVDDSDPTNVDIITPEIDVEKTDNNGEDIDEEKLNDTQTVETGDRAVFKIIVTNTGTEDLTDVTLIDDVLNEDRDAPNCNKTKAQTELLIQKIGNKDSIFNVGETFSYNCARSNTEENYTNKITVKGVGVTTKKEVPDDDVTVVKVQPEGTYDLALIKKYTGGDKRVGDEVQFTIEVHNQGDIDATDIEITDYVPTDYLELIDDKWDDTNPEKVTYTITDTIRPGEKKSVTIKFKILDFPSSREIENWAEISEDNGDDCDSTPDDTQSNDEYETDDYLVEKCDDNGDDEDDHDPATVGKKTTSGPAEYCEELRVEDATGNKTHTTTLTCRGDNPEIEIDCGNGQTFSTDEAELKNGDYVFAAECTYKYSDSSYGEIQSGKRVFAATCNVGNETALECRQEIKVGNSGNPPNPDPEDPEDPQDPSETTWCGDGEVQRTNDDGQNEECDFGDNNTDTPPPVDSQCGDRPAYCTTECELKGVLTCPGEIGLEITPKSKTYILGDEMKLFPVYNISNPSIRLYTPNDDRAEIDTSIWKIKQLCTYVDTPGKGLEGSKQCANIPSKISSNDYTVELPDSKINVYESDISELGDYKMYDNKLIITLVDDSYDVTEFKDAYFTQVLTARVSKPSVVTTGGGNSYVKDANSISDTSVVVDFNVDDQEVIDRNKNFSAVGVAAGLSASTTKVQDDKIDATVKEASNYVNNNKVSDIANETDSETNINLFKSYRGVENAYVLKDKSFRISNSNISSFSGSESKTYIIENGNLYIDDSISYDGNIAFVVKGGDIVIAANVKNLTGTYIAIPTPNDVGGDIKSAKSSEQLVVDGSLYGDITELTGNRTYLKQNGDQLDVGTVVSFGSSVFRKPAPLTSSFINEYFSATKVAK